MTKVKDLLAPFGFAQGRLGLVPFPKLARNRVFPQPVKPCPSTVLRGGVYEIALTRGFPDLRYKLRAAEMARRTCPPTDFNAR